MTALTSPPLDARRVLALATHVGDAVLGAGALLQRLTDAGATVDTLAFDGVAPLAYGETLVERLREALVDAAAQLVLAPSPLESDPDRRALGMAAVEALRRAGGARLALYEIGTPGRPTCVLDITAQLAWKQQQAATRADGPTALALNRFRGRASVPVTEAAEAFELLDAAALADEHWSLFATEHARHAVQGEAVDGRRDQPLVSVLVRSMDRPSLAEALDSIALQTYPNIEVLVVEACGPDHRKLGERCGRFPLRQVGTGQPLDRAAAANVALDHAAGDWLLFLDDDDRLEAAHIARLRAALAAAPRCTVAYAGVRLVDAGGQCTAVLDEPFDAMRLWCANYLPIHAVMFARALVSPTRRFDEQLKVYEDWDFWQQLACSERFLHVPGVSASYRLVGDSGLSAEQDVELARTWRLAFYRKWLPQLDAAALERLAAHAEHARSAAQQLRLATATAQTTLAEAQAALAQSRADAIGLQQRLDGLASGQAALAHELAERSAAAAREMAEQQAAQAGLRGQVQALSEQLAASAKAYAELERGYRQVTGSLSWRVTGPLRTLRGGLSSASLQQAAVHGLRRVARAIPVAPSTRQRIKVQLAASRVGAPLLRWLAAPPATMAAPAAAQTFDKEAVRAEAEERLTTFLARGERLSFGCVDGMRGVTAPCSPKVSVLVVLYNQAGLSLECLQALAALRAPDFELLIVDNASSDRVPQLLDRIDGATILRQADNLGFLRAVNLAASQARGEYLLLLNNDAVVFDDTLANACARLDAHPDIGALGGPILLWDGRLQEAGSIVWRDGSCLGYGRGESPDAGPYRYLRDVDYCSGAFLMLRRALFDALGGFDDRYAPAYYEESDLCARLWEAGHRVVCDPRVRVKHFEFASDVGSGRALALQTRNRERFVAKHAAFLAHQQPPSLERLLRARERLPEGVQRVLFIDDRVPLPWLGQGYPRAASLVAAVAAGGSFVTHYPLQFPHEDWADVYRALPERCEVMLGLGLAGIATFLEQRVGFYDTIVISRPHNMEVVRAIRERNPAWFANCRLLYDAEALFSLRDIAKAGVFGNAPSAGAQRRLVEAEVELARGADGIVTVSEAEARHFRDAGFAAVDVLGHAITSAPTAAEFSARRGFLFVGALGPDDSPNTDSVLWFVRECWPTIVESLGGEARLDIVGPCDSESVRALAAPSIEVHGRVDDLTSYFERARVFVVPTRFAAGIPHKAHEAAARGLPMVVTPLIADQLGWQAWEVPARDAPGPFASACIALHDDEAQWRAARDYLLKAIDVDCAPGVFAATALRVVLGDESVGAKGLLESHGVAN
ncbi:glycosyltransferase [Aquincola sp. S2]|uniref:Glycosyltransferase n=1 Tax=Pseudaquabacterium terrae TaxID=2732868 RepID=A0ABX2EDX2_9BURK|nr:glycosyltransferase [Aquabacterium terrae]NRF66815.1 glycosyltransferase [Aquabacterium terrae]